MADRTSTTPGIRKAAILLASLDMASAKTLLGKFPPEQARQVRRAVVALGNVDARERRRIIDEFLRMGNTANPREPQRPAPVEAPAPKLAPSFSGIELDGRLAQQVAATPRAAQSRAADENSPFGFLRQGEIDRLAEVLTHERAQTIAVVLSHLPSRQAGALLARFDGRRQSEIVRRLAHLEETDPEILQEIESAIRAKLVQTVQVPTRARVAGKKALQGILAASDQGIRGTILDSLTTHDPGLAESLGPPMPSFDEVTRSDDRTLAIVFAAADPKLVVTALIGAPPPLVDRVTRDLLPAEAEALREQLDHPGPLRLSDIEAARQEIAALAGHLALRGEIELSRGERLLAA